VAIAVESRRASVNADTGYCLPILRGAKRALPGGVLEDRDVVASWGDHRIRAAWAKSRSTGSRLATEHHAELGGTFSILTAVGRQV